MTLAVLLLPAVPASAGAPPDAIALLERAAASGRDTPHTGEVIWVTWVGGTSRVEMVDVTRSDAELTMDTPGQRTVQLSSGGSGLADHEQGWYLPLPAASRAVGSVEGLEDKYQVEVVGADRVLDRPATRLEVRRRDDGLLRERLWLDDVTGLMLRRESYDGETLLRMAAYLTLDLRAPEAQAVRPGATPEPLPLQQRSQQVAPVAPRSFPALRSAGWTVPEHMPGGYQAEGAFAVSADESQPLQLVYDDGLYTVSLFQQPGQPDWDSLPPGAEPVDGLGARAFEWPGAVPSRLVWETRGRTYSLVGDAPPDEFRAIAEALPHGEPSPGAVERVRTGLARLWSWASPWS